MDKKKVIELVKQAISELSATNMGIICTQSTLESALEELQKPDWISVDDKLPSYEEAVLVTSKEEPEETYFSHRTNRKEVIVDKHQFATYRGSKPITHWRKIDKLEVWT